MLFKLPQNKNIRKTILNVVSVYLVTTILLVLAISYMYITTQEKYIFSLQQEHIDIQAQQIINELETLDDNIVDEIAIYPRFENIKSAIYDVDKNLIFSTFDENITIIDKKYFLKNKFIYFVYNIEPYYLGAAYLVIQKEKTYELNTVLTKIASIVLAVILFLILTSFLLAKILLKPLSDNINLLDKFIKDTTHELMTPTSTILNNIEVLDLSSMNEKNIKKISRIKLGATTISNIYKDLSFLLLNNKQRSDNKNLNISEILNQRVEYFKILAENRDIFFSIDIQDEIYTIIDKHRIERLFDNLISNAIKFSSHNATIFVKLKSITSSKNIEFIIKDEGIGIKNSEINSVFTRYKKFNKNISGFGIGYDIINSIIKEYNIDIQITSQENKGTKVVLTW
ncbi:Two-component system histidine kinase DccS [hydrothermal vent metagenome]|uniref:histidine kinase n=1 Tax=hydrothermal vent metagenome TaxID=652676 RepID=A0A3B1E9H4_9ZZZZ